MLARDRQQGDLQSVARGGRRTISNCQDQGLGWRGLRQPQWEDGLGNQVGFQGFRLCGSLWYLPGEADHREEGTTCQVQNRSLSCGMWTEQLKYSRFAYFTIPLTTMAAGWMGGVELSKISLGRFEVFKFFNRRSWWSPPSFARDCKEAWLTGAIVPGGIMGIWTRWVETLFTFSYVLKFPFSNVLTFSFSQKSIWRHEDLHLFGSFRMDLPILHQQQSHQHNFSQLVSLTLRFCFKL